MHRQVARRPRRLAGTLTLVAAACAGSSGGGTATVVEVVAQPCDTPNRDIGLGVVVGDGLVMTAAHTVEGPRRAITVDGESAELVALDARTDLALLSADVDGEPAVLAQDVPSSAVLRTADGEQTVEIVRTGGLVVNDATEGTRHRREVHTFTPGVRAGTSGAPLVDADGAVIGVVVLANRGDGTAYAVTADEIADVLGGAQRHAAPPRCPG